MGPKRKSKERFLFKLCTYSQCSPHPAEQLYPSRAQKYILERFLLKENCNDDVDDDDKPVQGMESIPATSDG